MKLRDYFKTHTNDSKRKSLLIALEWLYSFIDFFRQDYLALDKELDQQQQIIMRQIYSEVIPDLISVIMRLKNSKQIDPKSNQDVENLNRRLLETVLQIFKTKD